MSQPDNLETDRGSNPRATLPDLALGAQTVIRRILVSWLPKLGCFTLVAVFITAAAFYAFIGWKSLQAEQRSQACWLTIHLLEEYLVEHNGQWPRSWSELEAGAAGSRGGISWPQDSEEVQQHVAVDFNIDVDEVVNQPIWLQEAVRAKGAHYVYSVDYNWLYLTLCVESGHYDVAIRMLDRMIESSPKFAHYYYRRGWAHWRAGNLAQAERDFRTWRSRDSPLEKDLKLPEGISEDP